MRAFYSVVPVGFALLAACTGKPTGDSQDSAPPLSLGDTSDCNTHAPVITSGSISNGGKQTFDNGEYPTVGITMDVSDDDGDLDVIGMSVWFDTVVDGTVDRSADPPFGTGGYQFENALPCAKFTASLTLKPAVTTGLLDYNTVYEFAIEAEDHHAVMSTPYIVSGVTPNSDGTDGTAS